MIYWLEIKHSFPWTVPATQAKADMSAINKVFGIKNAIGLIVCTQQPFREHSTCLIHKNKNLSHTFIYIKNFSEEYAGIQIVIQEM